MTYAFRHVTIEDKATGESFQHPSYTTSIEESIELARLTFSASVWNINPCTVEPVARTSHTPDSTPLTQTDLF